MRHFPALLMLPLLSLPAWAGDVAKPAVAAATPRAGRVTWEQRFEQASLGHDGHLTLEQAKSGDAPVAKHFDDIDVHHKGYVTESDVRAWRAARKAAHRAGKPAADRSKPRSAAAPDAVEHTPVKAGTTRTVAAPPIAPAAVEDAAPKE